MTKRKRKICVSSDGKSTDVVSAELLLARGDRLDMCGIVDVFGRAHPATVEVILPRIAQALLRQGAAPPQLPADARESARGGPLCGPRRYLSGNAARDYLDTGLFARNEIEVEWQDYVHPVYPQQDRNFVPYLSIVDLLFNCGEESAAILGRAGASERL